MQTLHIEHGVTSFTEWKTAFDRFAGFRAQGGVRRHCVRRPVGDPHYVVIDLDFDTTNEARAFLQALRERVWPSRQNAPALVGTPRRGSSKSLTTTRFAKSCEACPRHVSAQHGLWVRRRCRCLL
jgi:hypothetical protein